MKCFFTSARQKCFLRPERAPLLLALPEQRARQLEDLGIDGFLLLPFNHTIAQLSPEAFIDLLHESIPLAGIVVGENFRFGHKAAGNINLLRRLAAERELFLVPSLETRGPQVAGLHANYSSLCARGTAATAAESA